jgi:BirA family biotin operon repressor/biotin-[acetyl-CoA-carboxylase] ligase
MNQRVLEKLLQDLPLGGIKFFERTDSTNDRALELIQKGAPDLFLVIANEQTKGRGRTGKTWFTPPDSALAFSIIIAPNNFTQHNNISRFTGLGAVAVCKGLNELYHLQPKIKWPNDVLLNGKKVCGVLAEGHWLGEEIQTMILGIGINVASDSVPKEDIVDYPATCVEFHSEKSVDRLKLLKEVLKQILQWKEIVWRPKFLTAWQQHLAYLGERVQIIYKDKIIQDGKVIGLDRDGRLILHTRRGEETILQTEGIHLRPLIDK